MSKEVFAQIRDLKEQGKFVDAWNVGYEAYQQDSAKESAEDRRFQELA